jgi:hypothetical protein
MTKLPNLGKVHSMTLTDLQESLLGMFLQVHDSDAWLPSLAFITVATAACTIPHRKPCYDEKSCVESFSLLAGLEQKHLVLLLRGTTIVVLSPFDQTASRGSPIHQPSGFLCHTLSTWLPRPLRLQRRLQLSSAHFDGRKKVFYH